MERTAMTNKQVTVGLIAGALLMFGFGFALVPLYDVLCEQLGINGKTNTTAATYQRGSIDTTRWVNVEFIAQVQPGFAWQFTPKVKRMRVNTGQQIQTSFTAVNLADTSTVGQAVPSVSPGQGAAYFNKTECFCFNQQPLAAKASADLPLIFFIDPDLPESINTLTLSYTLYDISAQSIGGASEQGVSR